MVEIQKHVGVKEFQFAAPMEEYARLQVTHAGAGGLARAYADLCAREARAYWNHIEHKPRRVLDLGCGLGRAGVYFDWLFDIPAGHDAHYIFADSSVPRTRGKLRYGWNPDEWYNSLALTGEFAALNGVASFETFDLRKQNLRSLKDIDVVLSFLAVGFHFPIESYMAALLDILSKDCVLVFGIRQHRQKYTAKTFDDFFETCAIVELPPLAADSYRTKQDRLLILKGLK